MDEGGGALVGKVDQSGPRKITASKSVRWPMGGGFGRRQQSGKHRKLYTAYFESIRPELMVRRGFVALRDCQNLPQVCADMCEIEISHQDEDVTCCDMKFQGLPIF